MRDPDEEYMEEFCAEGLKTALHEEVMKDRLDAAHVARRADDWEARINRLYGNISAWLPEGWEARCGTPVHWQAPFMCRFGIPARKLPTLELCDQTGHVAQLWPDGLWILDANGLVNLDIGAKRYRLHDCADNFAPADWWVNEPLPREPEAEWPIEPKVVSCDWLRRILQ